MAMDDDADDDDDYGGGMVVFGFGVKLWRIIHTTQFHNNFSFSILLLCEALSIALPGIVSCIPSRYVRPSIYP